MSKKSGIDALYTPFLYWPREEKNGQPKARIWATTGTKNLVRNTSSGIYYARFRVNGKLVWRCLKTDVHTTAKLKLPDATSSERKLIAAGDGKTLRFRLDHSQFPRVQATPITPRRDCHPDVSLS